MESLEQRALRIGRELLCMVDDELIVEFARRLMAEQGEPVGIVRDLFTGRVQWLVELPHGTKLYASPPSDALVARDANHLQNLVLFINKICYHMADEKRHPHLWVARAQSYIAEHKLSSPLRDAAMEKSHE